MRAPLVFSSFLAVASLAPIPASAGAAAGMVYDLIEPSDHEVGCFGPCACPVLILQPVVGAFRLTSLGYDGLFENYEISDVSWTIPRGTGTATVAGSGHYRIGGEVALQHQMTLDLRIGEGDEQHFDSGLVGGGQGFPKIDIAVAVHGFFCWDTTFTIHAVPRTVSVSNPPRSPIELGPARPNPFLDTTQIELAMRSPATVTVSIHDALGRRVATPVRELRLEAGPHTISWNGSADGGQPVRAGLYFARATIAGSEPASQARAIVKLR